MATISGLLKDWVNRRFYTNVLGFTQQARPNFPFDGAWLNAGGLVLHLIQKDPSVDRNVHSTKVAHLHLEMIGFSLTFSTKE